LIRSTARTISLAARVGGHRKRLMQELSHATVLFRKEAVPCGRTQVITRAVLRDHPVNRFGLNG